MSTQTISSPRTVQRLSFQDGIDWSHAMCAAAEIADHRRQLERLQTA